MKPQRTPTVLRPPAPPESDDVQTETLARTQKDVLSAFELPAQEKSSSNSKPQQQEGMKIIESWPSRAGENRSESLNITLDPQVNTLRPRMSPSKPKKPSKFKDGPARVRQVKEKFYSRFSPKGKKGSPKKDLKSNEIDSNYVRIDQVAYLKQLDNYDLLHPEVFQPKERQSVAALERVTKVLGPQIELTDQTIRLFDRSHRSTERGGDGRLDTTNPSIIHVETPSSATQKVSVDTDRALFTANDPGRLLELPLEQISPVRVKMKQKEGFESLIKMNEPSEQKQEAQRHLSKFILEDNIRRLQFQLKNKRIMEVQKEIGENTEMLKVDRQGIEEEIAANFSKINTEFANKKTNFQGSSEKPKQSKFSPRLNPAAEIKGLAETKKEIPTGHLGKTEEFVENPKSQCSSRKQLVKDDREYFRNYEKFNPEIPQLKTFDQRRVDEDKAAPKLRSVGGSLPNANINYMKPYPQRFDFDAYEFYFDSHQRWKVDEFNKQYLVANQNMVNKKEVFKDMIHMIYANAVQRIDLAKVGMPKLFNDNKLRWCSLLVRSPKVQKIFVQFSDQMTSVVQQELLKNKDSLKQYLHHPRKSKSLDRDYPVTTPVGKTPVGKTVNSIISLDSSEDALPYPPDPYPLPQFMPEHRKNEKVIERGVAASKERYNYVREKKLRDKYRIYGKKLLTKLHDDKIKQMKAEERELFLQMKERERLEKQRATTFLSPQDKLRQKIMTEFQLKVKEGATQINKLIKSMDANSLEFYDEIDETRDEFARLEQQNRFQNNPADPGKKIAEMMEEWNDEEQGAHFKVEDLDEYCDELWLSLKEYEQQIKSEEKGYEKVLRLKVKYYESQISRLKSHCSMYQQAMETALLETKIKMKRYQEQVSMWEADVESKASNSYKSSNELDQLITSMSEENLDLRTVAEARVVIKKLVGVITGNKVTQTFLEHSIKSLKQKQIIQGMDAEKREELVRNLMEQRSFYQKHLLKLARDLNLYSEEKDKKRFKKFREINENTDDIYVQEDILKTLKLINFSKELINHCNMFFGFSQGIQNIKTSFTELISKAGPKGGKGKPAGKKKEEDGKKDGKAAPAKDDKAAKLSVPEKEIAEVFQLDEVVDQVQEAVKNATEEPQVVTETKQTETDQVSVKESPPKESEKQPSPEKPSEPAAAESEPKIEEPEPEKRQSQKIDVKPLSPTSEPKQIPKPKGLAKRVTMGGPRRPSGATGGKSGSALQMLAQNQQNILEAIEKAEKGHLDEAIVTEKTGKPIAEVKGDKAKAHQETKKKKPAAKPKKSTTSAKSKKSTTKDGTEAGEKLSSIHSLSELSSLDSDATSEKPEIVIVKKKATKKKIIEIEESEHSDPGTLAVTKEPSVSSKKRPSSKGLAGLLEEEIPDLLPKICTLYHDLDQMVRPKYPELRTMVDRWMRKPDHDNFPFRMKAKQIQTLQELVQDQMEVKFPYDEYMALFQPDIENFFSQFNNLAAKHFDFQRIIDFIARDGQPETIASPSQSVRGTKISTPGGQTQVSITKPEEPPTEPDLVRVGDMLRPIIEESGEFKGFQLRPELAKCAFLKGGQKYVHIRRILKICIYINRMMKFGLTHDFKLEQFKDGELSEKPPVEKIETEIQVDEKELMRNGPQVEEDPTTKPEYQILQLLKEHATDIVTRFDDSRKGIVKIGFGELDLKEMLDFKLANVYKNEYNVADYGPGYKMPFQAYLEHLFSVIAKKIRDFKANPDKADILQSFPIEEFVLQPAENLVVASKKGGTFAPRVRKAHKASQAIVRLRHAECQAGKDNFKKPDKLTQRVKNHLILDQAMEKEFGKTIDMFDDYVSVFQNISARKLKLSTDLDVALSLQQSAASSRSQTSNKSRVASQFSPQRSKKNLQRNQDIVEVRVIETKDMKEVKKENEDFNYKQLQDISMHPIRTKIEKDLVGLKKDYKKQALKPKIKKIKNAMKEKSGFDSLIPNSTQQESQPGTGVMNSVNLQNELNSKLTQQRFSLANTTFDEGGILGKLNVQTTTRDIFSQENKTGEKSNRMVKFSMAEDEPPQAEFRLTEMPQDEKKGLFATLFESTSREKTEEETNKLTSEFNHEITQGELGPFRDGNQLNENSGVLPTSSGFDNKLMITQPVHLDPSSEVTPLTLSQQVFSHRGPIRKSPFENTVSSQNQSPVSQTKGIGTTLSPKLQVEYSQQRPEELKMQPSEEAPVSVFQMKKMKKKFHMHSHRVHNQPEYKGSNIINIPPLPPLKPDPGLATVEPAELLVDNRELYKPRIVTPKNTVLEKKRIKRKKPLKEEKEIILSKVKQSILNTTSNSVVANPLLDSPTTQKKGLLKTSSAIPHSILHRAVKKADSKPPEWRTDIESLAKLRQLNQSFDAVALAKSGMHTSDNSKMPRHLNPMGRSLATSSANIDSMFQKFQKTSSFLEKRQVAALMSSPQPVNSKHLFSLNQTSNSALLESMETSKNSNRLGEGVFSSKKSIQEFTQQHKARTLKSSPRRDESRNFAKTMDHFNPQIPQPEILTLEGHKVKQSERPRLHKDLHPQSILLVAKKSQ